MEGSNATGQAVRVVVLSRGASPSGASLEHLCADGARCVRVSSAYEAAAELLAAPTRAIVIELSLLHGRHTRLLEIARDLEVEMLGVGSLPAGTSADDLSGLRLLARAELPAALSALTAGLPETTPAAHPEQPSGTETRPAKLVPKQPARRRKARRKKRSSAEASQTDQVADTMEAEVPASTPSAAETNTAPRELLSPEELSALLENDR